jgi:hypothetical protein
MSKFNIYLRSKTLNPLRTQKKKKRERENTCYYKKRRELANS